jgi:hypothetical protein
MNHMGRRAGVWPFRTSRRGLFFTALCNQTIKDLRNLESVLACESQELPRHAPVAKPEHSSPLFSEYGQSEDQYNFNRVFMSLPKVNTTLTARGRHGFAQADSSPHHWFAPFPRHPAVDYRAGWMIRTAPGRLILPLCPHRPHRFANSYAPFFPYASDFRCNR